MNAQRLDKTERYPYPPNEYIRRLIWGAVQKTVWRLCWHKMPILRSALLRIFGAKINGSILLKGTTSIFRPHDCVIGRHVAVSDNTRIYNLGHIEIGDNTVISQDVYLCGGTHDYTQSDLPLQRCSIRIGKGVWICAGAFIGPNVNIGDGAVVGARAVVMTDVEPMSVVAGNPAKKIKDRAVNA